MLIWRPYSLLPRVPSDGTVHARASCALSGELFFMFYMANGQPDYNENCWKWIQVGVGNWQAAQGLCSGPLRGQPDSHPAPQPPLGNGCRVHKLRGWSRAWGHFPTTVHAHTILRHQHSLVQVERGGWRMLCSAVRP